MLKIRRPLGRLIFNMGIAIPGKTVFLIETTPWPLHCLEGQAIISYKNELTQAYNQWPTTFIDDYRRDIFMMKNNWSHERIQTERLIHQTKTFRFFDAEMYPPSPNRYPPVLSEIQKNWYSIPPQNVEKRFL